MAHPLTHAENSARKFRGKAEDYLAIHNWFDESKAFLADFRHRALRHHAEGIFMAERLFGIAIVNSDGNQVPVRYIGEQHVKEDLGRIPTAQDWLLQIKPQRWMYGQRTQGKTAEGAPRPGNRCPFAEARQYRQMGGNMINAAPISEFRDEDGEVSKFQIAEGNRHFYLWDMEIGEVVQELPLEQLPGIRVEWPDRGFENRSQPAPGKPD